MPEILEIVGRVGGISFYLPYCRQCFSVERGLIRQQVDFRAVLIAPERYARLRAAVECARPKSVYDKVFEQVSAEVVGLKLPRVADFKQGAAKSRVSEIELGAFHEPFCVAAEVRPQQIDDEVCL